MDTTSSSLTGYSTPDLGETTLHWDSHQGGYLPPTQTTRAKHHPYLGGKIPLHWLAAAHALGGQCLVVGILLWYRRNLTKETVVWLPGKLRKRFNIPERGYWAAVNRLEQAGLISVERNPGQALRITLLSITPADTP